MGREGVGDGMGGVTNGDMLASGWVEVKLPIFGPAGAYAQALENFMAVV